MSSDGTFLDAAIAIGREITADAIWHDGRCSWVGVSMDPKKAWQREYRSLGATVYDGTAGVGLFLAELVAVTADSTVRMAAIGALRHAVELAPASRREGFHAGSLGVAWAAAHVADVLDDDELRAGARRLLVEARPSPDQCPDVLLGLAGSTLARLALADLLDEPALISDAVAGGEDLLRRAIITRHGSSWALPDRRGRRPLCGLSHGAAGIGWALVELFGATGDDRFRAGAEGAFAYERSWLHEASGTWPDLRVGGQRRGRPRPGPSPTVGSWCNGEAGIALTRLRALAVLGGEDYEHEAGSALETTRRDLAGALPYEIEDMTLCHGAAGAADVLHRAGGFDEPAELGHIALERRRTTGHWPCGPLGGTTPTLFRGLAGIGWWYLRLHDPAIPSALTAPSWLTRAPARA